MKEQRQEANPGAAGGGSHADRSRATDALYTVRRPTTTQEFPPMPKGFVLAAWWWIDRWRKSTAFTDMTLAEQGAYRNLLDELWLRDGLLPADERSLARASGDPIEWPNVREKIMAHFVRVEDGWRNETHDEIHRESARRAAKQATYRAKHKTVTEDVTGNVASNVTRSPSPSPSPSLDQSPKRKRTSVADAPAPWSHEAIDDWNERFGNGSAPTGRIGQALKPVVTANGWELVRPAWRRYLAEKESKFANPQDFAAHWVDWSGSRPRAGHVIPL